MLTCPARPTPHAQPSLTGSPAGTPSSLPIPSDLRRWNIPLAEERELALRRLKVLSNSGNFSITDFRTDPLRIFAAHEVAALADVSLATKMTVQYNLFGGTVLKLGTSRHHELLLAGIDTMDHIGCFALTELGFGNNAVEMQTTATFDEARDEFIIHTPGSLAQKYWITNGAVHAHWAVVFAQTISRGQRHGIHGFLVRLRNHEVRQSHLAGKGRCAPVPGRCLVWVGGGSV